MATNARLVSLDMQRPVWEQCYTVAPLVLVGTKEDDHYDLAPKHMVTPLGWDNYFGFVCTPRHRTYHNVLETGAFTVSFPRPDQVALISRAATPREEGEKTVMKDLPTVAAEEVDGVLLEGAYLQLECRLDRHVSRLGKHSLIIGHIAAARAHEEALRTPERDGEEVVKAVPLLAYLAPERYARIEESEAFPFPEKFEKEKAYPNYLQYFDTGAGSE